MPDKNDLTMKPNVRYNERRCGHLKLKMPTYSSTNPSIVESQGLASEYARLFAVVWQSDLSDPLLPRKLRLNESCRSADSARVKLLRYFLLYSRSTETLRTGSLYTRFITKHKLILVALFFVLVIFKPVTSGASDNVEYEYCQRRNLGWNFYCDTEVPEEIQEAAPKSTTSPKTKTLDDYITERDALRKEIEGKLARAVLEPTDDNIREYMTTQKEKIMEPATKFTNLWSQSLWSSPELDYTLEHPVNTMGKQAYNDDLNIKQTKAIKDLNKRYGIFFFYLSTCPYCHKYSPILKAFAEKHNLKVIAVSMDGGPLPGWPDYVVNKGQAAKFGMEGKPVPATILFDNQTKNILPVGFGLMGMDELEQRIYKLVSQGEENVSE